MEQRRTYRSPSLTVMGWLGVLVLGVMFGWAAVEEARRAHLLGVVTMVVCGGAVTAIVVEVFLRPRVEAGDEGVVLVNPFRTTTLPWAGVERIDTELALQVTCGGRRYTSWAATGSRGGRNDDRRLHARQPHGFRPEPGDVRLGRGGRGISAPLECRLLLDAARNVWLVSGDRSPARAPAIRWHRRALAATVLLSASCVLLLLVG